MTPSIASSSDHLHPSDRFAPRHLGPRPEDQKAMLSALGVSSMGDLLFEAIPDAIRTMILCVSVSDFGVASDAALRVMSKVCAQECDRCGYHNCLIPSVIEPLRSSITGLVHPVHALSGRDLAIAWRCCWLGKP